MWIKNTTLAALVFGLSTGCGQKAADTVNEKLIEHAISQSGENVEVDVDKSGDTMKMKIKGPDGEDVSIETSAAGDTYNSTVTGPDGQQKMTVKGQGENVEMTFQGEGGAGQMLSGAAAKIPAAFPKNVPLYDGLKLQSVVETGQPGAFLITGTTGDTALAVSNSLKAQATKGGWTIVQEMDGSALGVPNSHMLVMSLNNQQVSYTVSGDGDMTMVTTITEERAEAAGQ